MAQVRRRVDPLDLVADLAGRARDLHNETAGRALAEQEDWTLLGTASNPFGAGFANAGGGAAVAAFMLDSIGFVHWKGRITVGTVGNTIFTLAPGYRPLEDHRFAISQGTAFASVIQQANGALIFQSGTTGGAAIDLAGVNFRAEQ